MKKSLFLIVLVGITLYSCKKDADPIEPDCSLLELSAAQTDDLCSTEVGEITLTASGGDGTYTYSIDNGSNFQESNIFSDVGADTYNAVVKDGNNCEVGESVTVGNDVGDLTLTATSVDAGCGTALGEVTIVATGGDGVYTYSNDGFTFQNNSKFTALAQGTYTAFVKDGNGCVSEKDIDVNAGGVSYASDASAIIMSSCGTANCHDGSNSSRSNLTVYSTLFSNRGNVITKLNNGSMPKLPATILPADKETLLCWLNDGAPNN